MGNCSFYNKNSEFSLEDQIVTYLLSLVNNATGVSQTNQVTFTILPNELNTLQSNLCSDFELQQGIPNTGNRVFYKYNDIDVIIYQIYNT